jgi:hypothetical protein
MRARICGEYAAATRVSVTRYGLLLAKFLGRMSSLVRLSNSLDPMFRVFLRGKLSW